MAITPLLIDVAVVVILLFFTLRGKRRGLIKTLSGILALVIAFSLAGFLAEKASPYVSEKYIFPYISNMIEPKTEQLTEEEKASDPEAVGNVFLDAGVSEFIVSDAISDFTDAMAKSILEPITAMTNSIAYKITYSILFVIFFILSLVLLHLLFKILNLASRLPGINLLNKTLGLILGLILGYLIVLVLTFIMLRFGFVLTDEILGETHLLKFLINLFPLSIM